MFQGPKPFEGSPFQSWGYRMIYRELTRAELDKLNRECPPEDRYALGRIVNIDMTRYNDASDTINQKQLEEDVRIELAGYHCGDRARYLVYRGLAWRTEALPDVSSSASTSQLSLI